MDILKKDDDMQFTVMPDVSKTAKTPPPAMPAPAAAVPPPASKIAATPAAAAPAAQVTAVAAKKGHGLSRTLIPFGVTIVLMALIGYGAYFGYQKYFMKKTSTDLPSIYVDQNAAAKDTDADGLSDAREAELNTKPTVKDTDGDGLSDGDEVNIYQSDPLLPDTDGDKFDDGSEVARAFSPTVASSDKATAQELQKWQAAIEKFGLHEPTQSTLKLKAESAQADQSSVKYFNTAFKYSFDLPAILAYRESADRSMVGVFISGAQDLDPNFDTDPIFVSTAALAGGQSLRDFVVAQYPGGEAKETTIGGLKAVTWEGTSGGDSCAASRTFFAKQSTVVAITLTCSDMAPFVPYYQGIVQSFKYQ